MGCTDSKAGYVIDTSDIVIRIENINIGIDEARDEVIIPVGGKEYPPAEPPMRQDFKESVKWFDDDDDDTLVDYEELDAITEADATLKRLAGKNNYTGLTLAEIDKHAKTVSKKHAATFDSLLGFLTQPLVTENHRDLLTVRAIIVWMANQDTETTNYGQGSLNNPHGYLQLMKEKRATYTAFFTTLCRYVGVQCTFIHGICRGGDYQPGDKDTDNLECIWVAVRVEGTWQIIHPYWVCRAMIGQTIGGWIKLESAGKSIAKPEQPTPGMIKTAFKESYFMPKPEDFRYMCYPDDPKWQLLPPEKVVKSSEEFLSLPYLLPAFFGLGLSLSSLNCCELDAKNGLVDIVIRCTRKIYNKMAMTYDLFIKDVQYTDEEEMLRVENLPRLVLNSRCEERFSFQIRFPVEGTYKIVFYAGLYGQQLLRICEFKLNCAQRLPNCKLLPLNTGMDGWGPNPRTENAGLLFPSVMGGVISVKPESLISKANADEDESSAKVRFTITSQAMKENDYAAEMVSGESETNLDEKAKLNKLLSCKVDDEHKELQIDAKVPTDGEYGLIIKAGKKGRKLSSVCNYLLTTVVQSKREGVPQRKARKMLKSAMMSPELEDLTYVLEKCLKAKISEDDDDVRAAKNKLGFLKVKSDLQNCHKRRNLDVTIKTLQQVNKYRHKLALMIETRRAEKLKEQLEKLGGFTREVPQLKEASEELVYIANPSAEVKTTMKALFMLLEEPVDTLEEWSHIQYLLKFSHDQKNNVLNRMKEISQRQLDQKTRRKIASILHTFKETQVRHSSQAAASFYIWVDGVLNVLGKEKTTVSASTRGTSDD